MVRRVVEILQDDIDGGDAAETVQFSLDGTSYEIDLSQENAAGLRDALQPFIAAARTTGGARRRSRSSAGSGENPAEVRAWAEANGIKVNARGRIPADVLAAYRAAH